MPVEKYSISLMSDVAAQIARREGARSTVINDTLERYFWIVDYERRQLRQLLSESEISLICDVLNGTMFSDRYSVTVVPNEIQDGISLDHVDEKWNVDGAALVAKLRGLSYGSLMALVDAVQLWWYRNSNGDNPELTLAEVLK